MPKSARIDKNIGQACKVMKTTPILLEYIFYSIFFSFNSHSQHLEHNQFSSHMIGMNIELLHTSNNNSSSNRGNNNSSNRSSNNNTAFTPSPPHQTRPIRQETTIEVSECKQLQLHRMVDNSNEAKWSHWNQKFCSTPTAYANIQIVILANNGTSEKTARHALHCPQSVALYLDESKETKSTGGKHKLACIISLDFELIANFRIRF